MWFLFIVKLQYQLAIYLLPNPSSYKCNYKRNYNFHNYNSFRNSFLDEILTLPVANIKSEPNLFFLFCVQSTRRTKTRNTEEWERRKWKQIFNYPLQSRNSQFKMSSSYSRQHDVEEVAIRGAEKIFKLNFGISTQA